jgi:hypothetical protein
MPQHKRPSLAETLKNKHIAAAASAAAVANAQQALHQLILQTPCPRCVPQQLLQTTASSLAQSRAKGVVFTR